MIVVVVIVVMMIVVVVIGVMVIVVVVIGVMVIASDDDGDNGKKMTEISIGGFMMISTTGNHAISVHNGEEWMGREREEEREKRRDADGGREVGREGEGEREGAKERCGWREVGREGEGERDRGKERCGRRERRREGREGHKRGRVRDMEGEKEVNRERVKTETQTAYVSYFSSHFCSFSGRLN